MRRFQCIGTACEHTCCGGWRVHVDQAHYTRLRDVMERSAAEQAEFARSVEPVPEPDADPEYHATIRMRPDGNCSFLENDQRCSIQRRYGEDPLSNMCAIYPRDIARIDQQIEVTATLSCPEAARQCLLFEDAVELEEIDPQLLPRPHVLRSLDTNGADPYVEHFDGIRARILDLLSSSRYPLATRLFCVAYLAKRITPFFSQNATEFDRVRLGEELGRFDELAFCDELHRQFTAIEIPGEQAFKVIEVIVTARLQVHIPYFRQLVTDALSSYGGGPGHIDPARVELWSAYQRRREYWTTAHAAALDRWFVNYCKNYWLRDWYVQSPDLVVHTQNLLIRLAILRFLLFSDPRLQAMVDPASRDTSRTLGTLEATAIDVIHKVVRALEHDPSFLRRVQDALEAEDFRSFAHLVLLLRF
jgi:lysine-N-methylase